MTRVEPVLQTSGTECGLCCVAMLLAHHGRPTSTFALRSSLAAGRDGTALSELSRLVADAGLRPARYRANRSGLAELGAPVVAHWEGSHFVLVERVTDSHVIVVDPMAGRRRLTGEEFDLRFSGFVLAAHAPDRQVAPADGADAWAAGPEVRPRLGEIVRAWALLPRATARLLVARVVVALLLLVVAGATGLALASGGPVDQQVGDTGAAAVLWTTALAVGAGLASLGLARLSDAVAAGLHPLLVLDLQERIDALPDTVLRRHSTHQLLTLVRSAAATPDLVVRRVVGGIDAVLVTAVVAVVLAVLSPPALALLLVGSGLRATVGALAARVGERARTAEETASAAAQHAQVERIASRLDPERGPGPRWSSAQWAEQARRAARLGRSRRTTATATPMLDASCVIATLAAVTAATAAGGPAGPSTLALVTLAAAAALLVQPRLVSMPAGVRTLRRSTSEVLGLWSAGSRASRPDGAAADPDADGLVAHDLSVGYSGGGGPALEGVDLTVPAGRLVAVTGTVGSGRTTLLRAAAGLLEPTSGILAGLHRAEGGIDAVTGRPPRAAYVPQAARTGAGVLADLVADSERKAQEVLELLGLMTEVERLPRGLRTVVGERGAELPRGLTQGVLLARAVADDAPLLVLDEPTEGMDESTARRVSSGLARLDRACLVATRDPWMLSVADEVVILDHPTRHDRTAETLEEHS